MRLRLRLEDLDPERCKPAYVDALQEQLAWFGITFDAVDVQSERAAHHTAALDKLAESGRLYACTCSRTAMREHGRPAPGGGWAYPNTCRASEPLTPEGWRQTPHALRARLDDERIELVDAGGTDLSQTPAEAMGDPVVRRRDGAVAYQLAVVVDDAATGVTHIVRGRDIAPSTATQVALMRLLGIPEPTYRHHFLLREPRGEKLAKFHGSVGVDELMENYSAEALCGFLANVSGLQRDDTPTSPQKRCETFAWQNIPTRDQLITWDGTRLAWAGSVDSGP